MRIGIGLPVTTEGTGGELLLEWAQRAEEAGFDALTAIDRVVYPGFESLTALAATAAVTSRIGLRTNVLLAPVRSAVMVAKQAASVDQISGGRFMLGIGVGRRPDDYEAAGRDFHTRGRRLDADAAAAVRAFADTGVDEYIFVPTMADLAQVDRLAGAVGAGGGR